MLLDRDDTVRTRQLAMLRNEISEAAGDATSQLYDLTSRLEVMGRLPLVELTVNALRDLTPEQYGRFRATARKLIEFDRQISLFEYALEKCMNRHLAPAFEGPRRGAVQYYSIQALMEDIARVLSLLARVGHPGEKEASRAYAEAIQSLGSRIVDWPPVPAADSGRAATAPAAT